MDGGKESPHQLLVFALGGEAYGVDIRSVTEIVKPDGITRVPGAASCVLGIINLRGSVLPVMDLSQRLGLPASAGAVPGHVIVVDALGQRLGLRVDRVDLVLTLSGRDVLPLSPADLGPGTHYMSGMARAESGLVLLLDLSKVLSDDGAGTLRDVV